ncbi:MAG: creatininase family protein [Planctomycetota bacterium]|nr:creatininase family protein [Planctomycetota bacterium]
MSNGILTEMTIEDVRAFDPEVVAIGIGSVEPHGPVLPYGTDYWQCDASVRRGVILANEAGARALMYPTLPIGNNANFKAFPFACRIGIQTLMQVVLDIIGALAEDGINKIVLFDGHGGNTDTLRATLRANVDARRPGQGPFVCLASYPPATASLVEDYSDHGGESEVSRMLHLREDLVRKDKFDNFPWGEKPAVEALTDECVYYVKPWHLHVPASAGGDVRKASAEKGKGLIERAAKHLARLLTQLSKTPWSERFPYK